VNMHTATEDPKNWELPIIFESVGAIFHLKKEDQAEIEKIRNQGGDYEADLMSRDGIIGHLDKLAVLSYNELEKNVNMLPNPNPEILPMRQIEKGMLLRVIDSLWVDHLDAVEYLRGGIGLRGYGQRDPLVEYKREALKMFRQLLDEVDRQIAYSIYKIGMVSPDQMPLENNPKNIKLSGAQKESSFKSPMEQDAVIKDRKVDKIIKDSSHYNGEKVGRNDLCPCGSGKKYKHCHGK